MTRQQAIDAAVRNIVYPHLFLAPDYYSMVASALFSMDAIRAEFRRIMDREETCPIYGKKQ